MVWHLIATQLRRWKKRKRKASRTLRPAEQLEARALFAAAIDRITPDNGISATDGITNTNAIQLLGTATPGESVRITRGGADVGTVTTSNSGNWAFNAASLNLAPGTHEFRAVGADNVQSAAKNVTIVVLPPAAPNIVSYSTGNGAIINDSHLSNTSLIYVLGASEFSPIVQLVVDGQTTTNTGSPNALGNWSISVVLTDGVHTIRATAMDAAGNVSRPSGPFVVSVDTVPPTAPVMTTITPQVAPQVADSDQFTLWGIAQPYVLVQIDRNGSYVGSTSADANGSWHLDLAPQHIGSGSHAFGAFAWDAHGNVSPISAFYTVTVLGEEPVAPVVSSLSRAAGPGFNFQLTGTAEAGTTIVVSQAGKGEVGQTTTSGNGQWSFTHSNAQLANGIFSYTATVRTAGGRNSAPSNQRLYQPNIVLVNLDDMRADSLQYMPFVTNQLVSQGTLFTNSFVPTALSGPSRASLLSGLYAHNTGTLGNDAPLGGDSNRNDDVTLPVWLKAQGYRTGLFGKHETLFDEFASTTSLVVPPGWDDFSARYNGGLFYGTKMNHNGVLETYGNAASDYSTDVWANQADSFLDTTNNGTKPLFLYFAPTAPHAPFTPAPRHVGAYASLNITDAASFNIPPNGVAPLQGWQIANRVAERRAHLESLLAVDEAIAGFYNNLAAAGELDNTVFIVTADNGYQWGEHATYNDKNTHYEESIRVPLVVWDGRAPAGRTNSTLALNIDLAPTILDLAGAQASIAMDGVSLRDAIYNANVSVRSEFLIESWWEPSKPRSLQAYGASGVGIRTTEWKYNEFSNGRTELFRLTTDPLEMTNLVQNPAYATIRQQLANRLNQLRPADRTGPAVSNLSLTAATTNGSAALRLQGRIDDSNSGNTILGTPEYFIDTYGSKGSGTPLQASDGRFDSAVEDVVINIAPEKLASLSPGTHMIWVRGRDRYGNFGNAVSMFFTVSNAPILTPESDTGAASDGITTASALRWFIPTGANASVQAVAYAENGQAKALTVSGNSGAAAVVSGNLTPGKYQVLAVMQRNGNTVVTASSSVHVVGVISAGVLFVPGTTGDDQILVTDQTTANRLTVYIGGVLAGSFPRVNTVTMRGKAGNDVLNATGTFNANLYGEDGDDILIGGSGNDTLDGGRGSNNLHGNAGDDHYLIPFVIPLNNQNAQANWIDRVWEWAGNGNDTLDFANPGVPIFHSTADPLFVGSYTLNQYRLTRRVQFGDILARNIETILD